MFRIPVPECANVIVSAVGLTVTDELIVYRLACPADCPQGDDAGDFIEFNPVGCRTIVTINHNPILLDVPGIYELRFAGATNPDVRVCADEYRGDCRGK